MKTAIRTPIVEAIRSVIQGGGGGPVSPVPLFYWKGQYSLAATTGTDPTFTRATAATFEDFEGLIKTVESSEPRFVGARRVENRINYSEDLTKAPVYPIPGWSVQNGGTIDNASTFTFAASNGSQLRQYIVYDLGETGAGTFAQRVEVKGTAGQKVRIGAGRAGQIFYSGDITLTGDWQLLGLTGTTTAGSSQWEYLIRNGSNGLVHTINVRKAQFEITTGQTNQNPSEYVSTGVGTGPELVTNGDFATDSDWTKGAGWTISGGKASKISGSNGALQQYIPVITGVSYQVTYTVSDYVSGYVNVRFTGAVTVNGPSRLANGTYTDVLLNPADQTAFLIRDNSGGNFQGSISNVSIKRAEHGANVDGVEYFNTLNANTVTANVVTEAVGSALTRANTQFGELMAAGVYFATPNTTDNTIAGDVDVRAKIACNSYVGSDQTIVTKRTGSYGGEYTLRVSSSSARNLQFYWRSSSAFVVFQQTMIANPLVDGTIAYVRATRGVNGANYEVKFYSSVDGVVWVQEGSTQTVPTAGNTPVSGNTPLAVGALNGGAENLVGRIYNVQVYNGINGTLAAEFNAGDYVSGSTLVSSTSGETWTLVGNASIFQPPVDESGPFGYLAEKASTNLVLYSEDFTTGNWLQSVTVQADQATAPDGTLTADKVTGAGSGRLYQAINVLASTDYTFSLWVNSVDMTTFPIQAMNSSGLTNILTVDVISSLTVGAFSRVEFSFNTGTATNVRLYVGCTGSSSGWPAGQQAYLWGAQAEASTYPTSYIPTTTTAVTRNADVLIAGDMVTDAAGSGYAEASSIWANSPVNSSYILANGTGGRIAYVQQNSGSSGFRAYDGTYIATVTGTPSFYNAPQSLATTWGDAFTAYYNGAAGTPVAYSGTLGPAALSIGSFSGTQHFDGTIREVKIFNTELTAAEVGDL